MNPRTSHYKGFWDGYRRWPATPAQEPAYYAGYDVGRKSEDTRTASGASVEYIAWQQYQGMRIT